MHLIFIVFNNDAHKRNSKYKWRNWIYHKNVDIIGKSELYPLLFIFGQSANFWPGFNWKKYIHV